MEVFATEINISFQRFHTDKKSPIECAHGKGSGYFRNPKETTMITKTMLTIAGCLLAVGVASAYPGHHRVPQQVPPCVQAPCPSGCPMAQLPPCGCVKVAPQTRQGCRHQRVLPPCIKQVPREQLPEGAVPIAPENLPPCAKIAPRFQGGPGCNWHQGMPRHHRRGCPNA